MKRIHRHWLPVAIAAIISSCGLGLVVAQQAAAEAHASTYGNTHAWPFRRFQLGLMNGPNQAASIEGKVGVRYQYLSGGVNTGSSWQNWASGGMSFVENYDSESERHHLLPVFTYYQLRQSLPGADSSDEAKADLTNLRDVATMKSYYKDLIAFFRAASEANGPVVLHFEPDAFGYIEKHAKDNKPSSVPAAVSSTGFPQLKGLPNNASGWARAVIRLRNDYAHNVIVAYAVSIWGTDKDIHLSHPTVAKTKWMANRSAAFYKSLHADFDMVFSETGNEDAGEIQTQSGTNDAWWHKVDFARDDEYLSDFHQLINKPIAIWQIQLGNTIMRAMNNTPYHWQDNHVQWYLGADRSQHLKALAKAGVVALLFGSPQSTGTAAVNTVGGGTRDPHSIDGNDAMSFSSADDGGYFMKRANKYYHGGMFKIAG